MNRCVSGRMVIALLALLSAPAMASVTVYNNYGPGHDGFDYNWGIGWTIAGESNPSQFGVEQAHLFTASDSGALSDIWVPIWRVPFSTEPDSVTVHIAADTGGQYPTEADVLESWTLTTFPSWSAWSEPHHLVSTAAPQLEAGTSYWIWMAATDPSDATWCGWALNLDPALTLPHTLRREGESWLPLANETAGALRVDVVPEPTSILLLCAGGLFLRRR